MYKRIRGWGLDLREASHIELCVAKCFNCLPTQPNKSFRNKRLFKGYLAPVRLNYQLMQLKRGRNQAGKWTAHPTQFFWKYYPGNISLKQIYSIFRVNLIRAVLDDFIALHFLSE